MHKTKWIVGGGATAAALGLSLACRSFAGPAVPAETLPGVDLTQLDTDGQKGFYDLAADEPSPCKAGQSLIDALRKDPSCLRAEYAGRYLVHLEKADLVATEVQEYYEWRYTAPVVKVDVTGAPMEGDADAKVTIVEFADFECPHCKALQPEMQKLLQLYPKDIKIYFRNFPLPQHDRAVPAAVAAEAAGKQGKFWEMEGTLFDNQDNLEDSDIDGYAQKLGLDMTKFKADEQDAAVKQLVNSDRDQANDLKLDGTPGLFINGIEVHGPKTADELSDWIDEALARPIPPAKS
jgi:protein-disulfide isomerase